MRSEVFKVLLPWIVIATPVVFAPGILPGFCGLAFADAGAGTVLLQNPGGIAGGFFGSDAMAQSSQPMAPLGANPASDLCGPAIAKAGVNLPAGLLNAIAIVESGRPVPQTGTEKPWPWTIDANGVGYIYPTEQAAEQAAAGFAAAGITSLDIGCLQVNLAQHPDAFGTLAQAFDPVTNANYAAAFLASLEQKFGNWPQAVAAYHSQTPALGVPYAARVYAQWQGAGAPLALADAGLPNNFRAPPLASPDTALAPLAPQTAFQMSSLIPPSQIMLRSDHGMTGRSLASYRAAPVAIATSATPQG